MTAKPDTSLADIWLIRHAPSLDGGAMAGRRDVDADCSNSAGLAGLAAKVALGQGENFIASPARRCQQTAQALFGRAPAPDARLWEQDFGAWEGISYDDLPDLGPMSQADLAAFRPPQGESFNDLSARVAPALLSLGAGRHVIVAHAGVIRAALGLALGAVPIGLGFAVAALSLTRLTHDTDTGVWSVSCVNWTAQ